MHPKESRKIKNGTGRLTNKSLKNSEVYIGIDFSNNQKINDIINNKDNECYILYPGLKSISLNEEKIKTDKNIVLFLIDSTWPCSKKIIRLSKNLKDLKKISFTSKKISEFKIKTQPNSYCLSTIETTQYVLELLNNQNIENLDTQSIENFIKPFNKMVEYQLNYVNVENKPRYKR